MPWGGWTTAFSKARPGSGHTGLSPIRRIEWPRLRCGRHRASAPPGTPSRDILLLKTASESIIRLSQPYVKTERGMQSNLGPGHIATRRRRSSRPSLGFLFQGGSAFYFSFLLCRRDGKYPWPPRTPRTKAPSRPRRAVPPRNKSPAGSARAGGLSATGAGRRAGNAAGRGSSARVTRARGRSGGLAPAG